MLSSWPPPGGHALDLTRVGCMRRQGPAGP